MTLKNPKAKGNTFERKVARLLSDWSGVKFMRTPSSGAIHNFKDKRVVSDIVPPLSIGEFPFSIECKNVNCPWDFSMFITNTSKIFNKHWSQCCLDAEREGLKPWLVFTKNFRGIYSIMNTTDFNVCSISNLNTFRYYPDSGEPVTIFDFYTFLNSTDCKMLISNFRN